MHNIHANHMRDAARHPAPLPLDEMGYGPVVEDDNYPRTAAEQTLRALWHLKEEQREVLLMVAVEGLRYHEAATALGIPVGTVMSRLSRARERLREVSGGALPKRLRRVK